MIIASLTDLPREGESNGLVIKSTIVRVPSAVQAHWIESIFVRCNCDYTLMAYLTEGES